MKIPTLKKAEPASGYLCRDRLLRSVVFSVIAYASTIAKHAGRKLPALHLIDRIIAVISTDSSRAVHFHAACLFVLPAHRDLRYTLGATPVMRLKATENGLDPPNPQSSAIWVSVSDRSVIISLARATRS
jgi:hypothetical protein